MKISEVQHQPRAQRIIQRALSSRRMPHAYLFAGPEGVGREMLAAGLAQTLLCTATGDGRSIDACGTCQDCRLFEAGTHPDLYLIYRQLAKQHPESDVRKRLATKLSVDVIRHFLINQAGLRPSRGRARIFIVREAERMNDQAQNALLKTLEEPPPDTFIILLATSLDGMLPTTRSRCQQAPFQLLPAEFVRQRLGVLRPEAAPAALAYAARHSAGSLGQAIREIDDGLYAMKRAWGQRLVELSAAGPAFAAHALAGPFEADARALAKLIAERDPDISDTDATRAGARRLLSVLADFHVDALRRAQGAKLPLVNEDQPEVVEALARSRGVNGPAAGLHEIQDAENNLGRNANIQLVLEGLFIRMARRAAG